jgi:acyl-CoA thioesterase-1
MTRMRIVALGDSLTSGHGISPSRAFPAELQRLVDRGGFDYEVVNAGISRDTSADGCQRLQATLQGDVRIVIVALGGNDGLRRVPVRQLRANLSRIIEHAQARRIGVLLCAMEALPIYGWDYATAFHQTYQELAARYRVSLVPFILANVISNERLMQPDRIHPNAEGARRIADNIWPYLYPLLRRTAPASPLA